MTTLRPRTDGVVTIRPSTPADVPTLVGGRDASFHRFMGEGDPSPSPTACIVVAGAVVGWVDHDDERSWLPPGAVNVGYHVFEVERGHGYATRAVRLLLQHLAEDTAWDTATLLIDPANERSLALADRLGFAPAGHIDGSSFWTLPARTFAGYGQLAAPDADPGPTSGR
jgi:RimJ/RimL family protein N-acetyltransferase